MPDFEQFKKWRYCQTCGRCMEHGAAIKDGWLIHTYVIAPEWDVVRCFRHITDHSLRMTVGRTAAWRKKMQEGRERAAQEVDPFPVHLEPSPLEDI